MSKLAPNAEKTSSDKINELIRRIRRTGDAWNARVQTAAIAIITHTMTYGDCSGFARLWDVMPAGSQRTKLAQWLAHYTPIQLEARKGKGHAHVAKEGSPKFKAFNIDGAIANLWHEYEAAEKPRNLLTIEDGMDMVERLAKRLMKAVNDAPDTVAADDREAIAALAEALLAVKQPNMADRLVKIEAVAA